MKKSQLNSGVILNYVYIVLVNVSSIIVTPLLNKTTGVMYGVFILAYTISIYFAMNEFAVGNIIIRYITKYRSLNDREKEENFLAHSVFVYLILMVFTLVCLVLFYFNIGLFFGKSLNVAELSLLRKLFIFVMLNTSFLFVQNYLLSVITGYERFIFSRAINIVKLCLRVGGIALIFVYRLGAVGVFALDLSLTVGGIFVLIFYTFHVLKVRIRLISYTKALVFKLLKLSSFIYIAFIIENLFFNLGSLMLGAMVGTEATGVYYIAVTFCNILFMLSGTIVALSLPGVTRSLTENPSKENATGSIVPMGRIQVLVITIFTIGFVFFGRKFILLWLGWDFYGAYDAACVILAGIVPAMYLSMGDTVLQAKNLHFYRLISGIFTVAAGAMSTYIFIRFFGLGLMGAALGLLVSTIVGKLTALTVIYVKKGGLNLPEYLKRTLFGAIIPAVITVAAALALTLLIRADGIAVFLAECLIVIAVYAVSCWLFYLNKDEKHTIKGMIPFLRGFRR